TYTATVANAVAQITITPTSNHADASITIDNTAVASDADFDKMLSVGVNTIVIRVTAPDERTTQDYTLAITRAVFVASDDASLSALSISPGSLAENFAAATLSYTATLANNISSISVTPTVNHAAARVTVAGNSVNSGGDSEAITLLAGAETVIEVIVTAQNADERTYTLRITREAGKPGVPKNLEVENGKEKLRVTWEAPDDANGAPVSGYKIRWRIASGTFGDPVDVSGTAYVIMGLAAGDYKVQVLAVNIKGDGEYSDSQDGRADAYSTNADLSALVLVGGAAEQTFAVSDLTYTATVANDVASVKIRPTVADTGKATLMVDGDAVESGQESKQIDLVVGMAKAINVVVTAEDHSTMKTYTITVTRARSGDNALSALTLSAGMLAPGFVSTTLTYTVMVDHAVASLTFTPTPAHTDASVKVAGGDPGAAQSLVVDENRIEIVVTAQNGNTKTYLVIVTRAKSPDATLSALEITPNTVTLAPGFSPEKTAYTDTVGHAVAQITITPTSNHADAVVTIDSMMVARDADFDKALEVGVNTIEIIVTAPDGNATKTYTLKITRAVFVASTDNSLSALSISPGSLAESFAAATLSYTAMFANDIGSISVTPTVNESNAFVTVAGTRVKSGEASGPITLLAGAESVIEVVVTAQNAAKRTYTLRITREAGAPGMPKNLKVETGNAKLRVTWEAPDDANG
ncbi:MAG: cadherin-like beta sandwich domain-containing protein, partial [Gammaproteobacteria bacterium]